MGFPGANVSSSSAGGVDRDPVAAFLLDLEASLPELRRDLLAVADPEPEQEPIAPSSAQLAGKLRMLAQLAAGHRQTAIAKELGLCEAVMRASSLLGRVGPTDRKELEQSTGRLAEVLEQLREREAHPGSATVARSRDGATRLVDDPLPATTALPPTVLVVGSKALAGWLRAGGVNGERRDEPSSGALDMESTEDAESAHALVLALAPDVLLVDVDLPGAKELVKVTTSHPATQQTPIIALGSWQTPEQAAPLLELGVARVLSKPVSPSALRRACHELGANPAVPSFSPLGSASVEQLAARLSDELRRGLSDALDDDARRRPIELGPGVDVLAALWGAVARIRELVAAKSEGRIRFVPTGPDGAVPAAAWLTAGSGASVPGDRGSRRREPQAVGPQALAGRTIIVAEDDLSVNWFLAGVLRAAGARVLEARDGAQALSLALQTPPDLIVTDILMPGLDGFALTRAVRRDVVLRDVPVVLLSWKEDLLQRARELEVGAEGFLRKEESATTVVRHLGEVLQSRSRVSARISSAGAVHGRLDGLSAYSLLQLVCLHRPDSRVTLRDAISLYEIEIRRGRPVAASRVTANGGGERGEQVLQALLGVSIGRFGVVDATEAVAEQLTGSLAEQLVAPTAHARAAQSLLVGPALLDVLRIEFNPARVAALLDVTPDPAGGLLRALVAGASPREILESGRASASLLESVLSDAIRHGAIGAVFDRSEVERLASATAREKTVLQGRADAETLKTSLTAAVRAAYHFDRYDSSGDGPRPSAERDSSPEPSPEPATAWTVTSAATATGPDEDCSAHVAQAAARSRDGEPTGTGSVAPAARPASLTAPARTTPILASGLRVAPVPASAEPATAVAEAPIEPSLPLAPPAPPAPPAPAPEAISRDRERSDDALQSVPMPSAYTPSPRRPKKGKDRQPSKRSRLLLHVMIGVAGVSLAVGARWLRERQSTPAEPAAAVATAPGLPSAPTVVTPPGEPTEPRATTPTDPASRGASPVGATAAEDEQGDLPMEFDLAKDDAVGPGEGILEVVAGKNDQIYVGGKLIGKGPVIKVTLKATDEPYEVRVKLRGEERVRYALVKESKRVRLRVAPPWTR